MHIGSFWNPFPEVVVIVDDINAYKEEVDKFLDSRSMKIQVK